jgi:hypothetical protein
MQKRIASRLAFALLSMAFCSAAHALSFRAYLSVEGSDSNPCTVQLPCRLLPAALNAIVDGGEVWMLDSANFNSGPVDITKSVSILAIPGAVGSVVAIGGGPAINIATSGISVSLRNLVIVPFPGGGGTSGIVMTNGNSLTMQEMLIANLPVHGVDVNAIAGTRVKILDSVIRNNASVGVYLRAGAIADISNTKIIGNDYGVLAQGTVSGAITTAAVSDSLLSSNTIGLYAWAGVTGSTARWTAIRTTASHNTYGFMCDGGAGTTLCAVGNSMANGNSSAGFHQSGAAAFRSMGNNMVIDNPSNTIGTITPLAGT